MRINVKNLIITTIHRYITSLYSPLSAFRLVKTLFLVDKKMKNKLGIEWVYSIFGPTSPRIYDLLIDLELAGILKIDGSFFISNLQKKKIPKVKESILSIIDESLFKHRTIESILIETFSLSREVYNLGNSLNNLSLIFQKISEDPSFCGFLDLPHSVLVVEFNSFLRELLGKISDQFLPHLSVALSAILGLKNYDEKIVINLLGSAVKALVVNTLNLINEECDFSLISSYCMNVINKLVDAIDNLKNHEETKGFEC